MTNDGEKSHNGTKNLISHKYMNFETQQFEKTFPENLLDCIMQLYNTKHVSPCFKNE